MCGGAHFLCPVLVAGAARRGATRSDKDYSVELRVESAGASASQVIWHSAAASSIGDPLIAKEKAQEGLNGAVYVMRNAVKALVDAAAAAPRSS